MKLRYSPTSPFVRKVLMVAHEAGLAGRIAMETTNAWDTATDLTRDNPLCKVPALVTDGGESLFDSPVICEYLDSLHDGRKLFPATGGERWAQLRLQALADGILDAAVQIRIETAIRPAEFRWDGWQERQAGAINRGLDVLEQECGAWGDDFLIGQITTLAALEYLDFRGAVGEWRGSRPALAAWAARMGQRPSAVATAIK
ncbi:MAG TPA: glutathione S-transferase N-terminal domain-containing protein [Candidatus Omnitrophota bacterium]|nr:glutathione S-transferase N-terminal domain-containing protein [Candidatus Omnitrophota bacterium]